MPLERVLYMGRDVQKFFLAFLSRLFWTSILVIFDVQSLLALDDDSQIAATNIARQEFAGCAVGRLARLISTTVVARRGNSGSAASDLRFHVVR